jgi:hypothetical protein
VIVSLAADVAFDWWKPTLIALCVAGGLYLLMWRGWRKRGGKHDLPPLPVAPAIGDLPAAKLQSGARYFGTTVSGEWLDRIVAHGLGARSSCRLNLSDEGLDVIRMAGSFRIPAAAIKGARHDQGIAGKVVPPHGLMIVTWQHGDLMLDTGFRLQSDDITAAHNVWIRTLSKLARTQEETK